MAFQAKYWFKANNEVVIQHPHGKFLRVTGDGDEHKHANGNGGRGKFARWMVELCDDNQIKLKSKLSGKYLRIIKGGDEIDVQGGGGKFTLFKVHVVQEPNKVKLESVEFEGKYVAVRPNGKDVFVGGGGGNCPMTFYRNAGGGGGGGGDNDVKEDEPAPPAEDSDSADYDKEADKDAEPVKVPDAVEPLSDDAEAVKAWLDTVGYDEYADAFIENGYDKMSTVAMLDEADLEKMGVKAGHQKELMIAARCAVFVGHWVAIRNVQKERFVEANEGNKEKLETNEDNKAKDCRWFVEQSPNHTSKVRLRSTYNSYIRMPNNTDKHMVTVDKEKDIDNRIDLQIIPTEDKRRMNIVKIWCPSNGNYMTYDENVMKDRVNSLPQSDKKGVKGKQKWELIIVD